ncbi:unnamed protein product [Gadus morhua 'NCC']
MGSRIWRGSGVSLIPRASPLRPRQQEVGGACGHLRPSGDSPGQRREGEANPQYCRLDDATLLCSSTCAGRERRDVRCSSPAALAVRRPVPESLSREADAVEVFVIEGRYGLGGV